MQLQSTHSRMSIGLGECMNHEKNRRENLCHSTQNTHVHHSLILCIRLDIDRRWEMCRVHDRNTHKHCYVSVQNIQTIHTLYRSIHHDINIDQNFGKHPDPSILRRNWRKFQSTCAILESQPSIDMMQRKRQCYQQMSRRTVQAVVVGQDYS